jgi:hypothetical protein
MINKESISLSIRQFIEKESAKPIVGARIREALSNIKELRNKG